LLRSLITRYVITPAAKIIAISTGESGVFRMGSNRKPLPYLKSTPPINRSSPIYIRKVIREAVIAGIINDI
jgi:hypothetical protein